MDRVMIVDDEQGMCYTIKNMLDWESLGCMVVAVASSGEEAWQIYKEAQPEIVLMEVKLPDMNGMELMKWIKLYNDNTQIIVISRYSDFELVKTAMKTGAYDYLLKRSLSTEDLKDAIIQAKAYSIAQRKCRLRNCDDTWNQLRHCLLLIKNDHGNIPEEAYALLESSLFHPYRNGYRIVYFRIDQIDAYYHQYHEAHKTIHDRLEDIIMKHIPNYMRYELLFITNHSGVILFQAAEDMKIQQLCHKMMHAFDLQLSMTMSENCLNMDRLFETYAHVLECHKMRFYVGQGVLIDTKELSPFQPLKIEQLDFHTKILDALSVRDYTELRSIHREIMIYMKTNHIHPEHVLDYEIFILNNMEGNELKRGIKTSFGFQKVIAKIHRCETIDYLDELLLSVFIQIEGWLKDDGSNRYGKDITEIINYVEANYTEKLTLQMLANRFGINESYLSRMFKKQTGKNLIYYINEMKIHKARELLSDPNMMVKEAAYAVGYEDQFYFNKLFKRFFGVSPTEFRRRIMEQKKTKSDEY